MATPTPPPGFTCSDHPGHNPQHIPSMAKDVTHKGWVCVETGIGTMNFQPGKIVPPGGAGGATPPAAGAAPVTAVNNNPSGSISPVPAFTDQCFLLEKAMEIYKVLGPTSAPSSPSAGSAVNGVVRQLGIKPLKDYKTNLKYANHITGLQGIKSFFEITPEEAAQLAHYTVVSVGNRKPDGTQVNKAGAANKSTPIFTSNAHKDFKDERVLQSRGTRTGAGIKSIDVTYEGIDSATKKIVLVNAQFVFQDIRTMVKEPYSELFKLLTKGKVKGVDTFRTIDFEIGWRTNRTLAKKLNLNKLILHLRTHLVKYTFDLQQDGSVVVNAQYRGQIVDMFGGPNSNILSMAKGVFSEIKNALAEIQDKAVQLATAAQKTAEAQAEGRIARILLKRILERSTSKLPGQASTAFSSPFGEAIERKVRTAGTTGTGTLNTQDALFDFKGTPGVLGAGGKNASLFNQMRHEGELAIAALGRSRTNAGATGGGIESTDIQREFDAVLKNIQERIEPVLNSGKPDSEKAAAVKVILNEYKDVKEIERRAQLAAAANAGVTRANKNALDQQLRKAKTARFFALQQIAAGLIKEKSIKYAYIKRDPTIANFQLAAASSVPGTTSEVVTIMKSLQASSFLQEIELTETQMDEETFQVIPFVHLGKLIENVLKLRATRSTTPPSTAPGFTGPPAPTTVTVYDLMKETSGDFNIDFGYVSYKSPYTGTDIVNLPLYYMPISLLKINDFFAREIVATEKSFFAFDDFILTVLRKFLTGYFALCNREANTAAFVSPKVQVVLGDRDKKVQYFIYGFKNVVKDVDVGKIKFGNYNSNFRNHIYHFYLGGQIKGAVKNVKLTDIADETTKTAVYYQNRASERVNLEPNSESRGGFPPVVFQAEIQTMGFPMFNMGQLIYVDLRPYITGKDGRQFKANGYYGVTKVNHNFTPEGFSSTVNAIIQYSKFDFDRDITATTGASATPVTPSGATPNAAAQKKVDQAQAQAKRVQEQAAWVEKFLLSQVAPTKKDTDPGAFPGAPPAPIPPAPIPPATAAAQLQAEIKSAETAYKEWQATQTAATKYGGLCAYKNANKAKYNILLKNGKITKGEECKGDDNPNE